MKHSTPPSTQHSSGGTMNRISRLSLPGFSPASMYCLFVVIAFVPAAALQAQWEDPVIINDPVASAHTSYPTPPCIAASGNYIHAWISGSRRMHGRRMEGEPGKPPLLSRRQGFPSAGKVPPSQCQGATCTWSGWISVRGRGSCSIAVRRTTGTRGLNPPH